MEEAISRLTLALEELEEKRREEEIHRSVGENWKKIARTIDRCSLKTKDRRSPKFASSLPSKCTMSREPSDKYMTLEPERQACANAAKNIG